MSRNKLKNFPVNLYNPEGKGDCELIDESNNETISLSQWKKGVDLEPIDDVMKINIFRRFKTIHVYEIEKVYNNDEETVKYVYADSYYDDENDENDASKSEFTIGIGKYFENYEDKEVNYVLNILIYKIITTLYVDLYFRHLP